MVAMQVDEGAPSSGASTNVSASVRVLADPEAVRLLLIDADARRQPTNFPEIESLELPRDTVQQINTILSEGELGKFFISKAEGKELTQLGKDNICNKKVAFGFLMARALGIKLELPIAGAREHWSTNWQEILEAAGNRVTSKLGHWKQKAKSKRQKTGSKTQATSCSADETLTVLRSWFDPAAPAARASTKGNNFSCEQPQQAEILALQQNLVEAQQAQKMTASKLDAAETKAAEQEKARRAANSRFGTAVQEKMAAEQAAAAAEAGEQKAKAEQEEARAQAAAAKQLEVAAKANLTVVKKELASKEKEAAAAERARAAAVVAKEKVVTKLTKEGEKREAKMTQLDDKVREQKAKLDESKVMLRNLNTELLRVARARASEEQAAKKAAADFQLQLRAVREAHEEELAKAMAAEAQVEGLGARNAALQQQLDARAALRHGDGLRLELERKTQQLADARNALAGAERHLAAEQKVASSLRSELKLQKTACRQAEAQSKALSDKLKELPGAEPTDYVSFDDLDAQAAEEKEQLLAELAEQRAEAAALRVKLGKSDAELAKYKAIAEPPESRFYSRNQGGYYTLPLQLLCLVLITYGVSTANVSNVITNVALFLKVQLPTYTQRTESGMSSVQRVRLPCESTVKEITHKACIVDDLSHAIKEEKRILSAYEKGIDPTLDSGLNGTTDGATSGKVDFQAMTLRYDGEEKSRVVCLKPCASGTTKKKVELITESLNDIKEVAEACRKSCTDHCFNDYTNAQIAALVKVNGFTTDKGGADFALSKSEAMQTAKREALHLVLGRRHLATGRVLMMRVSPVAGRTALVEWKALPTLAATEANMLTSHLRERQVTEIVTTAVNRLLAERPSFSRHAVRGCLALLIADVAEEVHERGAAGDGVLQAARPRVDGGASIDFDEDINTYREKVHLDEALGYAFGAAGGACLAGDDAIKAMSEALLDHHAFMQDVADRKAALTDGSKQLPATDEQATAIGAFLIGGMSAEVVKLALSTEHEYCHEHGLVNTTKWAEDAVSAWLIEKIGTETLEQMAALQGDKRKTKADNATKWKTCVGYYKAPLWHFMYRTVTLCNSYGRNENGQGVKYRSHLVAIGKLDKHGFFNHQLFANICGNRDHIFWYECAVFVNERANLIDYFESCIASDEGACSTMKYCLAMAKNEHVFKAAVVCGALYYAFTLPCIAGHEHLKEEDGSLDRRKIRVFDQAVFEKLVDWEENTHKLLLGDKLLEGQRTNPELFNILANIQTRVRSGGDEITKLDPDALELAKQVVSSLARGYHHYHKESMRLPYGVAPGDEDFEQKLAEFKKAGGGSHLDLSDAQIRRGRTMEPTSKASERVFAIKKRVRMRAITRSLLTIAGLARCAQNGSALELFLMVMDLPVEKIEAYERVMQLVRRARKAREGGAFEQALSLGNVQLALREAKLAKRAQAAEKLMELKAKLNALRGEFGAPSWARIKEWAETRANDLLDLVRAFAKLDDKDVRISDAANKLSRLQLLVELYGLEVPAAELDAAAGRRWRNVGDGARGARLPSELADGRLRGLGRDMWKLERLCGAMTRDGVRLYLARWLGEGWDESHDQLLTFRQLCAKDKATGELILPCPEIQAEVEQYDEIADSDWPLITAMEAREQAAREQQLQPGARVCWMPSREEDFTAGEVVAVGPRDGEVRVRRDDDGNESVLSRDVVLSLHSLERTLHVGDRVRAAVEDQDIWFYGEVAHVDERGELITLTYDDDEVETRPEFRIQCLRSAAASAGEQQARRGKRGRSS